MHGNSTADASHVRNFVWTRREGKFTQVTEDEEKWSPAGSVVKAATFYNTARECWQCIIYQ
jgi:hypothetical protein